jgi:serpin B
MSNAWIAAVAASLIFAASGFAIPQTGSDMDPDTNNLVKGNNTFAFDVYHELCQREGNLFYSPHSISTALAMTYAGARGQTAEDMAKALDFPFGGQRLQQTYAKLIHDLNKPGQKKAYQLSIANRLWGQKNYGFLPDFVKTSGDAYGAGLEELNFSGDTEGSRKTINAWVEKQTQDKIKDLLPQGSVGPMTRLILTNAIYFKASWANAFSPHATKKEDFKTGAGKSVQVDMMHGSESMPYVDGDSFQLVEVPYEQHQLSMLVLLPKKADGLADLEKRLSAGQLDQWLAKAKQNHVHLALPKFTFTSTFDNLQAVLAKLGMGIAFSDRADFGGMASGEHLFIDKVIHKAFVAVDEKGTEAAAATAIGIRATSAMPGKPIDFVADHPFVFLIRDRQTGSLLFVGRVSNPQN